MHLQLLVFLYYAGCSGSSSNHKRIAKLFGISQGTVRNYIKNVQTALVNLKDHLIQWPQEEERQNISNRIHRKYGFPNCIGLMDGTTLPLQLKPKTNGEDYYTRKGFYAVHVLLTCDDTAKVRHLVVGWPGSVHDNRVWRNCKINRNKSKFFTKKQYILTDSAFTPSDHCVPA